MIGFKGAIRCLQSHLSLISAHDFLGPKKITGFIVDLRSVRDQSFHWNVLVLKELITPISSFGKKRTLYG